MNTRRIFLATVVAIVATSSSLLLPATAAAPKEPVSCDLSGPLGELAQIKAAGVENDPRELELRKELLKASMDCNAREAAAFRRAVSGVSDISWTATSLKRRYEADLEAAEKFAASQGIAIDALKTVEESKELARQLREWRDGTYNMLAWRASQLVVVSKNMALAQSGAQRVEQLEERIASVQTSADLAPIKAKVAEASELIALSQRDLGDALSYLRDGGLPEQEQMASKQKSGLDALSRGYDLLIEANDSVTALPPPAEASVVETVAPVL